MNTVVCALCKEEKPQERFSVEPRNRSGFRSHCKDCVNETARLWRIANPQRTRKNDRRRNLLKKYGIDEEIFDQMLEAQGGVCAICGSNGFDRRWKTETLSIDHDHEAGNVRGLLCTNCNIALGNFQDSPIILQAALDYLSNPPFRIGRYEGITFDRECKGCGQTFNRQKLGNQVYCSIRCRTKYYNKERRDKTGLVGASMDTGRGSQVDR